MGFFSPIFTQKNKKENSVSERHSTQQYKVHFTLSSEFYIQTILYEKKIIGLLLKIFTIGNIQWIFICNFTAQHFSRAVS